MEQQAIKDAIALLDTAVPRDGARVRLAQYGGGPDESQIVANEAGFLRLGIEILKAAFSNPSPGSNPSAIELDLDYLLTNDSTIGFDWVERTELPPEEEVPPSGILVAPFIILGVLGLILLLAIIGGVQAVRWLAA